jgi:alkylated DNA repair dioxygenase AlkB
MKQYNLFDEPIKIPGLKYIPEYISSEAEKQLIDLIDSSLWNTELKRRTQHYGYKYDYRSKSLGSSYYLGKMPYLLDILCNKLYSDSLFAQKPDQVIVNEYMPGQGIAPHIDCVPCFSDTICSLSLTSGCVMDLTNGNIVYPIYLEPRSLLILKGEVRYKWKHGISPRKRDNGIKRERRISLTFRNASLG